MSGNTRIGGVYFTDKGLEFDCYGNDYFVAWRLLSFVQWETESLLLVGIRGEESNPLRLRFPLESESERKSFVADVEDVLDAIDVLKDTRFQSYELD